VWDGSEILYEIRYAVGGDGSDVVTSNSKPWRYGRVTYTAGPGIDQPLEFIRMSYGVLFPDPVTVVMRRSFRGLAETGTYPDGRELPSCNESGPGDCFAVSWPGRTSTAFLQVPDAYVGPETWHGSVLDGKRDATGQVYMRNRYDDPSSGRFTQEDPIGLAGGLNLYGFASGDPVNFSDPFGLCPWCIAYVVFELGSTLYDLGDLAVTGAKYLSGSASGRDVLATAGGAAFGLVGFGGGYGRGARKLLSSLDNLSGAARLADRGGLSKAGRALTKHARGQRSGSELFPELSGNVDDINKVAGDIVDDILTNPQSTAKVITRGRFKGGVDVYDPSGRGVRYDADGAFVTFLERRPAR
jgi:RHS repeat-associated protein